MTIETPPHSTIPKSIETTSQQSQDTEMLTLESDTEQNQKLQSNRPNQMSEGVIVQVSDLLDQEERDQASRNSFPLLDRDQQLWGDSERLNQLRIKLENVWLNDDELVSQLKDVINNAVYEWPKGTILVDYKTKLSAIKEIVKLKWYYKPQTVINVVNAFAKPPVLY